MVTFIGLFFALLNSVTAGFLHVRVQKDKLDPAVLSLYKGFGICVLMMPFVIFMEHPTSLLFYILVIANGVFASISTILNYSLINKHGAEISSKLLTVPPVFVAVIWWLVKAFEFLEFLQEDTGKAIGAILCLIGMLFSIFIMGYNKKTHKAVIKASPIFIFHTIQIFLFFFAIKEVTMMQAVFHYMFLQGFVIGVCSYFIHVHHLKGHVKDDLLLNIFDKDIMKRAMIIVMMMLIAKGATNIAMKYLPNPSYVPFITNLQIIWIYLIDKHIHLKNAIPPTKGVLLAIFAIMFIILTS